MKETKMNWTALTLTYRRSVQYSSVALYVSLCTYR